MVWTHICSKETYIDKNLLVTECLRLNGLEDPLLCPDIETDINEPIESQPRLYPASCNTRETSASDEPVNVETGLVFAEASELHDCIGALIVRREELFSKKKPSLTCNSSCDVFDFPFIGIGLTFPPSSSVKRNKKLNKDDFFIINISHAIIYAILKKTQEKKKNMQHHVVLNLNSINNFT